MKNLLLILVLITLPLQLFSQISVVDSLDHLLVNKEGDDTVKVNLLLDLFAACKKNREYERALAYNKVAAKISHEINFKRGIAKSIDNVGSYYYNKGDLATAAEHWLLSLEEYVKLKDVASQSKRSYYLAYCYLYTGNIPEAMVYSEMSMETAKSINSKERLASALALLGDINKKQNDFFPALSYCSEALVLYRELNNERQIARTLNVIGEIYGTLGDYPKATEYFFKVLEIAEKNDDKFSLVNGLFTLGAMNILQEKPLKAKVYFQRALAVSQELKNEISISNALTKLGEIEVQLENYSKALEHYNEALEISERVGAQRYMAENLYSIAVVLHIQGESQKAIGYLEKAAKTYLEIGFTQGAYYSYHYLGNVYLGMGDYVKALHYTEEALGISLEKGFLLSREMIYKQLSEVYSAQGRYKEAYENHLLYKEFSDSLFNRENVEALTTSENQYQFNKEKESIAAEQEKKDAIQAAEIKYQKQLRNAFVGGFLLFLLLTLIILRNLAQKRKANQLLAAQKEEISYQSKELHDTNEALVQLSGFKEDMTNMMVHDLKNPISSILNVELIKDIDKRTKVVKYSAYKMMNLVQNILDVYKYKSVGVELHFTVFDLGPLVTSAMEELSFATQQKQLKFAVDYKRAVSLKADAEIFRRILVNIFSNAVKFAPANSTISIVISSRKSKDLRISVHNIGPHIPKDKQEYIFEKFGQSEKQGQGKMNSTGLGLSFCQLAVEAHKGKIGVESEQDKGAMFWFTMPEEAIVTTSMARSDRNSDKASPISLTAAEKEGLKTILANIEGLTINELTAFRKVFVMLDEQGLGNPQWNEALQDAVYSCNEAQYSYLVNLISE